MKKIIFVAAFLAFSFGFAQDGKIRGVVLDGEFNNEPLAFVNINVKETNQTFISNIEGKYTLSLKPGKYTLVFDFIGYKNLEVKDIIVKKNETITIDEILRSHQLSFDNEVVLNQ